MPISYPAIADPDVTNALIEAVKRVKAKYRVGLVLSKDAFYSEEPERVPLGERAGERWKL